MVQTIIVHRVRINLRLSQTAKRPIEQAAPVEGKTVSAFIVSSALVIAEKTIDRHETLALAHNEASRFFDALTDPPPLNDRLRAALEEAHPARRLALIDSDALIVGPPGRRDDRAAFSCNLPELGRYLARQAAQEVRHRIVRRFVGTVGAADVVLGFYTLSALSIDLGLLPDVLSRKPPAIQYPAP